MLTPEALAFLAEIETRFGLRRKQLLEARTRWQAAVEADLAAGRLPGFRADTQAIRQASWRVAPIPAPLQDRRVEITGPVDRKMMINALNSGAQVFMADFEDSHSPTWEGTIAGQVNLQDAVRGQLVHEDGGKRYEVGPEPALLVVRVRGLHLDEAHIQIGGRSVAAAFFDFAMAFWHNAQQQAARGNGPFYYLPKLESAEEAALWSDIFSFAEDRLGLPRSTIRATVLIETLPAALQMDEILHALRHHVAALNAGRWDYIFSCIKTFRSDPTRVLPDRSAVTMTAPFMRAYTQLLVRTCHRRGAFAMGGMSAFIPDKRDPQRNEKALAAVRADKVREARDGFDGTWVAHPGLVEVALEAFEETLQGRRNQCDVIPESDVDAQQLTDLRIDAPCTMEGLRQNVDVGIRYLDSWLAGRGAAAIHGLMEDAATAEISRSQVWQWLRHHVPVDGKPLESDTVRELVQQTVAALHQHSDDPARTQLAAQLFEQAALQPELPEFLTLIAYPYLEETA